MGELKELNTIGEVAAYCRVHPQTVRRWMSAGVLKVSRLPGGQIRIKRVQVLVILDAQLDADGTKNDPSMR